MSQRQRAMRLPPLKVLRVHNAQRATEKPCVAIMTTVLACWASAGYNAAGCAAVENQLRLCMDGPAPAPAQTSTINHHLGRMQKHLLARPKR